MVLIIRNSRILSSRQSRVKKSLPCVDKDQQKLLSKDVEFNPNKEVSTMSLVGIFGTLLIYSTAMFTLPFAAFFGVQHIMKTEFEADRFVTNCVSVLATVLTVNLIISCYAYQALHEPDDDDDSDIKEITDEPSKDSLNKKLD